MEDFMSKEQDQIHRLTAERDLLLSAIRPEELATIQERLDAIVNEPSKPGVLSELGHSIGNAIGEAKFGE
jgi:hypothetical protein